MKSFKWIIILLLMIACQKDKTEYPLVQTGSVIEINPNGVVFHGKIMNLGSKPIIDHGFVWEIDVIPFIETSYVKSLGEEYTTLFSSNITSAFIDGENYYLRAYVRSNEQIIYGRSVTFISQGGNGPQIIDFNPKIVTWGDTLYILGKDLALKREDNKVKIGVYNTEIIHLNDSILSVKIPIQLDTSNISVEVSVFNIKSISSQKLNLYPPEIIDFNPKIGVYETPIKIIGRYFNEGKTKVYFDDRIATITSITDTVIWVTVPSNLTNGEIDLSVIVATQKDVSDIKYNNVSPEINSIIPLTGTWNDIITIEGLNFSNIIDENIVKFGNNIAQVIEASANLLKVKVPSTNLNEQSQISVSYNEQSFIFTESFILLQPIIQSFDPIKASFRDIITITGKNFNPIITNNKVTFGDIPTTTIESKSTELKVVVPDNYSSVNGKNKINISIGDLTVISENDFELKAHVINDFSPKSCDRNDQITITGENFNPVPELNKVFIGNTEANVINADFNSLTLSVPIGVEDGNQIIRVVVAGREVFANAQIAIHEPWSKLNDFPGNPRNFASTFSIDDKAYVGGGKYNSAHPQNEFWEYDSSLDKWTQKPDLPFENIKGLSSFSTNSKGYILHDRDLWQYDPLTETWNEMANFPRSSIYGGISCFSIGNKGYAGNGHGVSSSYVTAFWEYDEASDVWTRKANFNKRLEASIGFSINNKGYIIPLGGYLANTDLYEYDSANDTWSKKLSLLGIVENINKGRVFASSFTINGKGYITTGSDSREPRMGNPFNDIYEYDPITNTLKRIVDLPASPRMGAVGFAINNKGYVGLGAQDHYEDYQIDFWKFDQERIKK